MIPRKTTIDDLLVTSIRFDPPPPVPLCFLIEATANIPEGEHHISAGRIRSIRRLARTDLAGLLPVGFDPLPGVERGEVEATPGVAHIFLRERIAGASYRIELLSIVRSEHAGVTWTPGARGVLLGVVRGRVVSAVPSIGYALQDREPIDRLVVEGVMCGGSGMPADCGISTASAICPTCRLYVAVVHFVPNRPVLAAHNQATEKRRLGGAS